MNKFILAAVSCLAATSVFAGTQIPLQSADQAIVNFQQVLPAVKKALGDQVIFPSVIPAKAAKKYFLYQENFPSNQHLVYGLSVDATEQCHGAHYCMVGEVRAEKNVQLEKQFDRDNKVISQELKLANGTTAYFTPGHAMGDYWPPMIQWQQDAIRYTITWNVDKHLAKQFSEQQVMEALANSAVGNS